MYRACRADVAHFDLCGRYGECSDLEKHDTSDGGLFMEVALGDLTHLNLWKTEGSTWNVFEANGTGTQLGQCDTVENSVPCPTGGPFTVKVHCEMWYD